MSFSKLWLVWSKAISVGQPMKIDLTSNELLASLVTYLYMLIVVPI